MSGKVSDVLTTMDEKSTIYWGTHKTPLGNALIATTDRGVCAIAFTDSRGSEASQVLAEEWPEAKLVRNQNETAVIAEELSLRMHGKVNRPLPLAIKGSSFQVKVWQALLDLPQGKLTSYQEIARAIGAPKATQAVGTAIGSNRIAYLIPCHRVVRAAGDFGQYRWGAEKKRKLIALEGAVWREKTSAAG